MFTLLGNVLNTGADLLLLKGSAIAHLHLGQGAHDFGRKPRFFGENFACRCPCRGRMSHTGVNPLPQTPPPPVLLHHWHFIGVKLDLSSCSIMSTGIVLVRPFSTDFRALWDQYKSTKIMDFDMRGVDPLERVKILRNQPKMASFSPVNALWEQSLWVSIL